MGTATVSSGWDCACAGLEIPEAAQMAKHANRTLLTPVVFMRAPLHYFMASADRKSIRRTIVDRSHQFDEIRSSSRVVGGHVITTGNRCLISCKNSRSYAKSCQCSQR